MRRAISLAILLSCASAFGQMTERVEPHHESTTPWYLPRAAHLYVIPSPSVSPSLRIAWEIGITSGENDGLLFLLEGGGAYSLTDVVAETPTKTVTLTFLYQHAAMAGIGYRHANDWQGFHWGFSILSGPLWYGARYEGTATKTNSIIGAVEGRAQLGWTVGKVTYGVTVGYLQMYEHPLVNPAVLVLGGPTVGVFAEWW